MNGVIGTVDFCFSTNEKLVIFYIKLIVLVPVHMS